MIQINETAKPDIARVQLDFLDHGDGIGKRTM
jgi:hypothetical protein